MKILSIKINLNGKFRLKNLDYSKNNTNMLTEKI